MTNEEIKNILDGAKVNDTHFDDGDCFESTSDEHNITDLREILELRQEVERLKNAILQIGSAKTFGDAENKLTYAESLCQTTTGVE